MRTQGSCGQIEARQDEEEPHRRALLGGRLYCTGREGEREGERDWHKQRWNGEKRGGEGRGAKQKQSGWGRGATVVYVTRLVHIDLARQQLGRTVLGSRGVHQ